jgi:TPR repeat protein
MQHMQHEIAHGPVLSADAHLSLALSAFPWEWNDNAIPPKLYHSESMYSPRGMKFVQDDDNQDPVDRQNSDSARITAKEALMHLEKSSELGNPYAQNILASILASGILPFDDDASLRYNNVTSSSSSSGSSRRSSQNKEQSILDVPSDFASGGQQLARALVLWHMSAMGGNIEAAMALGYRHYISATSGDDRTKFVMEEPNSPITGGAEGGGKDIRTPKKQGYSSMLHQRNNAIMKHSPLGSSHYGVLGTCETSLAYYEAAANGIMDELETGPLRGKVLPARDQHKLAEIHQRGASSKLAQYNKPDELEEAIKYYKIRANNVHNPDLSAMHKLANLYHYGLKGVKQDMKEALKYYEMAADLNSWEAAGQAGKFHLLGMGVEGHERNLKKALDYFRMGTPGGLNACRARFQKKLKTKERDVNDDFWNNDEFTYNCDHPSVNGMGLLHLYGVPMMVRSVMILFIRSGSNRWYNILNFLSPLNDWSSLYDEIGCSQSNKGH